MTPSYGARSIQRRDRRTLAELAGLDLAIIEAVQAEHPVTLRGVYYRVVSAGAVGKTEAEYRRVGRRLVDLRRAGRVPYHHITDGTRYILRPTTYGDLDEMLADVTASYRRALWDRQGSEVHLFVEKDAISGVVQPVCERWDVPLGVLRGYASESFAHSVAVYVAAAGRPVYLYQLGDHDPSGLDAWRDFSDKVRAFAPAADLVFERLAVTPEQVVSLNLPTRPTKTSDTRSRGFRGGSVEVDAIPPSRLRGIVEEAITGHLDEDTYRLTRQVEAAERRQLQAMIAGGGAA